MSRKIKRSLAGGALAAIISVMLMLGSTMAWFQDTEVLINTFTFGELKVDIVDPNDPNTYKELVKFLKSDGTPYAAEEFLFEPGATFILEQFCVKNKGTVPFHYDVELKLPEDPDQDLELMEAMELQVVVGGAPVQTLEGLVFENQFLEAGGLSEPYQLQLHMKESAGNQNEDMKISGIQIRVLAYQEGATADIARENAENGI